jgi:hypothetical protein
MSDPKQKMGEPNEQEDEAKNVRDDTPKTSASKKGGTLRLNMSETDVDFSDPYPEAPAEEGGESTS